MSNKDDIAQKLCQMPSDARHTLLAYVGPTAEYLARLEERISELETARPMRIESGDKAIDTRPGLSVQDVTDLIRAAKGAE